MPGTDSLPAGSQLPIDGDWMAYTRLDGLKVRIEEGKMFVAAEAIFDNAKLKPGMVLAYDIRQTAPTQFRCEWAILEKAPGAYPSTLHSFAPSIVELSTDRSLIFDVPEVFEGRPFGGGRYVFTRTSSAAGLPESSSQTVVVSPSPSTQRIAIMSEVVEIPAGSILKVTRSREIEHVVSLELDIALSGELSLDVVEFVKASVKAEIEARGGRTFKERETKIHELTLDGNQGTRYKLTWYHRVRPGIVRFKLGDRIHEVPFRFPEEEDFEAIPLG